MTATLYIATVFPMILALIVNIVPSITGDFIERHSSEMAREFRKTDMPSKVAIEVARFSSSLAKGNALVTSIVSSTLAYFYSFFRITSIFEPNDFVLLTLVTFGVFVVIYFFFVFLNFKIFELSFIYVRNPIYPHYGKPTAPFTHYELVRSILIISNLFIIITVSALAFVG